MLNDFTGIYSLMLTPYNDDKTVDYETYEEYCDFTAEKNPDHFFAVCGSSELSLLTLEERLKLASLSVKHKGFATVVATANMEKDFNDQIEEVKRMSDTGVDGLVFTTKGLGNEPRKLVEYIGNLRRYTSLPVLMYEFPGLTPHNITGETYGRLVKECGISGIKDTTRTLDGIKSKIDNKRDSVVIQANIPYLLDSYKAGARGVMATPTTCGVSFFRRFHDAFIKGDLKEAERRYNEIILLDNALNAHKFGNSARYLAKLQGVKNMKIISRAVPSLTPADMRSLESFYAFSKENGLMK